MYICMGRFHGAMTAEEKAALAPARVMFSSHASDLQCGKTAFFFPTVERRTEEASSPRGSEEASGRIPLL